MPSEVPPQRTGLIPSRVQSSNTVLSAPNFVSETFISGQRANVEAAFSLCQAHRSSCGWGLQTWIRILITQGSVRLAGKNKQFPIVWQQDPLPGRNFTSFQAQVSLIGALEMGIDIPRIITAVIRSGNLWKGSSVPHLAFLNCTSRWDRDYSLTNSQNHLLFWL